MTTIERIDAVRAKIIAYQMDHRGGAPLRGKIGAAWAQPCLGPLWDFLSPANAVGSTIGFMGAVWTVVSDPEHISLGEDGEMAIIEALRKELAALRATLDAPEIHDFARGVQLEAAHQRKRWGSEHDAGKAPADWFWLVGYLAGKALHSVAAGQTERALHHTISTAAALCNWHAAILGKTNMRPGIAPPPEAG